MEDVHAGIGQRLEEGLQLLRGLHQARGVVLLLPLRVTQDDREVRADRSTHGLDQLDGEARTRRQITTVLVSALVAAVPEELVDQVTVGAVNLHAIHADGLGIARSLGEGSDHLIDIGLGHTVYDHLAVLDLLHRAIAGHAGIRLGAQLAHVTHVPELRDDLAAFGMHRVDHLLPAGQGVFAVETRHVRVAVGGLVADGGAFGDDQANARSRAATVILDDLGVGHATGREGAGHRRHDHTGRQLQVTEAERGEQGLNGCAHHLSSGVEG